ncbi:membrane-anchored mycosin MYCP [Nocardioides salarius]|uniref:Membrane-anchored mycosin MYCP n=1 Tax=Nocardioides salarius TaxID=374513 RepID=A0ABS2M9S7_9ACTN|nr:S8 family serine peptidase [Nocardioides salarius]MBM7507943.1 membrane-anchored mycosin MYCP [Nocardioides salarius]
MNGRAGRRVPAAASAASAAVGALTLLALAAGAAAPAAAVGGAAPETRSCTEVAAEDPEVGPFAGPSRALEAMGVPAAHEVLRRRGVLPGEGVTVAVVDTGIAPRAGLPAAPGVASYGPDGEPVDPHGTVVAGLVAAPPRPDGDAVGVAPGARLVDVRVLDAFSPQEGQAGPLAVRVAEGLEHVLAQVRRVGGARPVVDVVNVSVAVPPEPRIDAAVEALWRAGVVVVAESGDRPVDEADPLPDELAVATPGEDAASQVHPAGAGDGRGEHVLGVAAVGDAPDAPDAGVLRSSAIDVAAPTVGGVSVGLNGGTCGVDSVSTSWAAAQVTGVVALLMSAYPDDTPEQVLDRLLPAADGRADVRSPTRGAGVVRADEALARGLGPPAPEAPRSVADAEPATAPVPEPDLLASVRDDAVWWGVLGGGALLLALVLRPVLARRDPARTSR